MEREYETVRSFGIVGLPGSDCLLELYHFVQELSYRKQIVHQLRTQYVEGIDNPVR